ncbi:MAG: hypothetical protein ACTHMU_17640, partial [Thermomicrobiales bacterium]
VDFGQFFAASGKEILDTIGPLAAGLRDLVDGIDRVTNNGALKFALLAAAVAKFHREIQLAYGVVTGSVNLFQPQRNDQGQLATGSERARAAQTQDIQRQLQLYQQLQQEQQAAAAADVAVERARAQVATATDQAIRQQLAVTLAARKDAAQAAAAVEKAAYAEATAAFRAQQAALVDAARQSSAIAKQTARDLAAAEREYQAALKASESAVKAVSVAELQRQQQAKLLTTRQAAASDLDQYLRSLEQEKQAITQAIENSAGGRSRVEANALLQQTAIAQREAAQRAVARAQLERQISPGDAADAQLAEARTRLADTQAAENALGTKSIELLASETAKTKEIDQVTKEYTRSLIALQAQQERVAAAEEKVIATQQEAVAAQRRAGVAGVGVQATQAVDVVANQQAARAAAAVEANAAQREATIQADAQTLIAQKTAAAAQQQTTASAAVQIARQNQVATTQRVAEAEAALVAAEEKQAAAQAAIVGTQNAMNASTESLVGRLAGLSQVLGIAVVAVLAVNAATEKVAGVSIPDIIRGLAKYGDALGVLHEKNRQLADDQIKAFAGDPQKVQQQISATQQQLLEAQNKLTQVDPNRLSAVQQFQQLVTDPLAFRNQERAIQSLQDQLDELNRAYERATGLLHQYTDAQYTFYKQEEERRSKGQGTFIGPIPVLPARPEVDQQLADQQKAAPSSN